LACATWAFARSNVTQDHGDASKVVAMQVSVARTGGPAVDVGLLENSVTFASAHSVNELFDDRQSCTGVESTIAVNESS
jgi:hypothetical protein